MERMKNKPITYCDCGEPIYSDPTDQYETIKRCKCGAYVEIYKRNV